MPPFNNPRHTTPNKAETKKNVFPGKKITILPLLLLLLLLLLNHFSPIPPTTAQIENQGIVITDLEVTLNVHVNITSVQLSFTLLPVSTKTNSIQFTINGHPNGTIMELKTGQQILYNQSSNETHTTFKVFFPKAVISPGSTFNLDVTYNTETPIINGNQQISFEFTPQSKITTTRIITWIDSSLSVTLLSPQPINKETIGKLTRVTWVFFQQQKISITINTIYNPNNKFTTIEIFPQTILIKGLPNTKTSFNINITSTYPVSQIISVISLNKTISVTSPITIEPYKTVKIPIIIIIPEKQATYQIVFLSKIPNSQPVILQVLVIPETQTQKITPAQLLLLLLIILLTATLTLLILRPPLFVKKAYNYLASKKPLSYVLKPVAINHATEKRKDSGEKPLKKQIDMNTIALTLAKSNYFDKNEKMLLAYLLENQGISQQKIADALSLSKATVSRTISKLQGKQLIIKEQSGMTNKIFLNEENFYATLENIIKSSEIKN